MEEYKGYTIKFCSSLIGYEIEYIGRGSLHLSLRGIFTDKPTAKKFIDEYLKRKEGLDDENVQPSRSKQIQQRSNYRRKSSNNS